MFLGLWHQQYLLEDVFKVFHSKIGFESSRQSAGNSQADESPEEKKKLEINRQFFNHDHSTLELRRKKATNALLALEMVVEINRIRGESELEGTDKPFAKPKHYTQLRQQVEFQNVRPNSDKVFGRAGDQLVNRVCQSPAAAARRGTVLTFRPPVQTFEMYCYVWSLGEYILPFHIRSLLGD